MKLLGLSIENVRLINAFSMKFEKSGLTQIRGKNQAGKTTILDCIEMLFKGTKSVPKDVVSHGKSKANIIGEIDGYTIQRSIKGEKSTLKVVASDGKEMPSPQKFLDTLINALTFDPRPFLDKDSKGKKAFMMDLLKIDFSEVDAELKEKESERTLIGRLVKSFGNLPILKKVEEVDVSSLMAAKSKIDSDNATIDRGLEKKANLEASISRHEGLIEKMKQELAEYERLLKLENEEKEKVVKALASLGEKSDSSEIDGMIANASNINKAAAEFVAIQAKKKEKEEKEEEYDSLTHKIETLRESKVKTLLEAKVPVEGLEIKVDGLYYNGIHSENWSDSQSMRISCELCAAMKPQLNAIFIDRGEAYDSDQLKALGEWAEENDIQALITIVDSMGGFKVEGAIYIEEGEVV